jgi:DNA sulfur modification protein DndB
MAVIILPAIKGQMGDWSYYVTVMKMGILATEMNFGHELHPHAELDRMIQRKLSDRSEEMKNYLLRQPQRFYGAIVAAVYGGNPKFYPVQMAEHRLLDDMEQGFGVLKFDGSQRYFALDGQHRLASIKLAVKENPDLASEEISVIFVNHMTNREGEIRTRRLFTTLNRYARPVSLKDSITMDEDDAVAVVTRLLIRYCPLFAGKKIIIKQGKAIPPTEKSAFTNLLTLYECNENILNSSSRRIDREFKQVAKSYEVVEQMYSEAFDYWQIMADTIPSIKRIWDAQPGEKAIEDERSKDGGNLIFRPLGQIALAKAIRKGLNNGATLAILFSRLLNTPLNLSSPPWVGVVWHQGNKKMLVSKETSNLATKILEYYLRVEDNLDRIKQEYKKALDASGQKGGVDLPFRVED